MGLSCRTAGGINTPEKLWDFLLDKKHASGDIPAHRWEPWRHRDSRNAKILDNVIRKGYFLDNLDEFDAAFFGISPKEAELMDPHQRLALELTWEALENSGIDPSKLAGSDTAVYMGVDSDDYSRMLMEDLPAIEAWSGIGTAAHGIPNRISYYFDLQGPSIAVDAACASALVAIHLGRQVIVLGESTVALCGGVNVICAPGLTQILQKAGALTAQGVCRSFDDSANGYERGEGGAVIVLKRLRTALEDNDNILAVLKSSASAQDGRTNGIMAPNSAAQALVAGQALSRAGNLDPHTVDYVEAHATSTALGDTTEVCAISQVYGIGRSSDAPCYIGSIMPNVGHLEAAAGAIGFVKTVLSVQKGVIAPQALLENLNSKIDWATSGLEVVRETTAWPRRELRSGAICCYGYGGSVCHAIIEQAPPKPTSIAYTGGNVSVILTFSAKQKKCLPAYAASLAHWLSAKGASEDMTSIARILTQRRIAHDYRASFVVSNRQDAIRGLRNFAEGREDQHTTTNRVFTSTAQKGVVWTFSGHGSQWPEMGKELLLNRVFRTAISDLDTVFQREANFSSVEALEKGKLDSSAEVQMLTYAMQIGLTLVLKGHGITPQAVVGHSVGEIAAAVVAGCLTVEEGAIIVSRRSKLYTHIQGQGAMALVSLPFKEVAAQLGQRNDVVAAVKSSPLTCVVSGTLGAIGEYLSLLNEKGIKSWRVKTDIAFHSPMLKGLVAALKDSLGSDIRPRSAIIPIYSTSDPDPRTSSLRGVEYWICNMIAPVYLTDAVEAAVEDGFRVFLEVSTHPIVSHSIYETLEVQAIDERASFGIMSRGSSPNRTIFEAISELHTLGAHVDFGAQLGDGPWSTKLPNTPWFHKPYWKVPFIGANSLTRQHDVEKHTLLGNLVEIAESDTKVWATTLDETAKPYPLTHVLGGVEIIPAAVYCNTIRDAAGAKHISNLELRVPIPITAEKREVQVILKGEKIRISSRLMSLSRDGESGERSHQWVEHCKATFSTSDMASRQEVFSVSQIKARIGTQLANNFALNYLKSIGVSGIAYP